MRACGDLDAAGPQCVCQLALKQNAMPTAEKAQTIELAKDWYSKSKGVVFTDYRGLSVKQVQKLRSDLRAKGGELHVIKNTLFQRAIGDDASVLTEELQGGPTAYAFLFDNETELTKMLFDFAASSKKLTVKGAIFAGKTMTEKQVEAFSKLPSRDVLIAQVIGAIAAPMSNLVGTIEALYADPIRVIGAVADKVAEGSPAPAPKAAAVESSPAPEATPAEDAAPAEEAAPAEAPVAEATPEGEAN